MVALAAHWRRAVWLTLLCSAAALAAPPRGETADAPDVTGDAARGAQAYEARCTGCHAVATDRVGPRHAGVFGRRAGSIPGFAYSPALRASPVVWDRATLTRWLTDPETLIPGQRMGFRVDDAAVRADIVAYLATLTAP